MLIILFVWLSYIISFELNTPIEYKLAYNFTHMCYDVTPTIEDIRNFYESDALIFIIYTGEEILSISSLYRVIFSKL